MTRAEAGRLRVLLSELFPAGDRDPADVDTLVSELGDLAAPMVASAARSLARSGREWSPSASQLRAHTISLALDLPDWGAVVAALHGRRREQCRQGERIRWTCPAGLCSGDGWTVDEQTRTASACSCREAMLAARRTRDAAHPALAAWLDTTPTAKLDAALNGDTTAEAQLRDAWHAWCRDLAAVAAHQGIDPAGLPALERAAAGRAHRDTLTGGRMPDLVAALEPAGRSIDTPDAAESSSS